MIDFHTHILPGVDDGSPNLEISAGMIREEAAQGTDLIAATPHFYANRVSIAHFVESRDKAFAAVENWLTAQEDRNDLPVILTGAEVYYFSGMGRAEALPFLCFQGTQTILLEMPFKQWGKQELTDVKEILERQKLNVVLAHVERYIEFQKDRSYWEQILSLPVVPQINAGSFLKKGGFFHRDTTRKFCFRFLEEHPQLILGSDAHNLTSRRPNLAEGREAIASVAGEEALIRIDQTTKEVLGL